MKAIVVLSALVAVQAAKTTPRPTTLDNGEVVSPLETCNDSCKSSFARPSEHVKTIKSKFKTKTKATTVSPSAEPDLSTALDLGPGTAFPPYVSSPDCTQTTTVVGATHPAVVTPPSTTSKQGKDKDKDKGKGKGSKTEHSEAPSPTSPLEEQPAITTTSVLWKDCGTCALFWTTAQSTYAPRVTVANPTDYTYTITQVSCLTIAQVESTGTMLTEPSETTEAASTELPEPTDEVPEPTDEAESTELPDTTVPISIELAEPSTTA
ncbi:hypothetical protein X797_003639 [Metarhizium robertsii]|uniref:Uncharacterized protein n=2 Tax=Metarhizium robertsii TaxID=568076 RepID=A0A0B2XIW1_METRA|nr:uncharacterized protein MAA_10953 [Metarhizium robertsii ARSEF 23]EXV03840.1 hypothetical protein X797_003639 [Metarhizium robertsii]KHO11437.1 hypothetical protein MAA_10953 [Metarhizium robertsii ARSEF 23]